MEHLKTELSPHVAADGCAEPTREQRDEGRRMMEEAFVRLMDESRKGGIRWKGTLADLMELRFEEDENEVGNRKYVE